MLLSPRPGALTAGSPRRRRGDFEQLKPWDGGSGERIHGELSRLDSGEPEVDQREDIGKIKAFMDNRVLPQILMRPFEQRRGGSETVLLQMNERAGQLNQAAIKIVVRLFPVGEPEFLKNLVRLEVKPVVEAFKKTEVVSVQIPAPATVDERGDLRAFMAHGRINGCDARPSVARRR